MLLCYVKTATTQEVAATEALSNSSLQPGDGQAKEESSEK